MGRNHSRGGQSIFFEHHNAATYPFGFNPYVIPPGGARIDRLEIATGVVSTHIERPGGAFQPTLSPDGSQLAYLHRSLNGTVLLLQDLETRRERRILEGLDRDRQDSREAYGPYPNLAWHPDGRRLVVSYGGAIQVVDVQSRQARKIPFSAPVRRPMSETIRFATELPVERAQTRTHRWGSRTPNGILFEALGDIWIHDGSRIRNITDSEAFETSPITDPNKGALYFASWTDDDLGGPLPAGARGRGHSADSNSLSIRQHYVFLGRPDRIRSGNGCLAPRNLVV